MGIKDQVGQMVIVSLIETAKLEGNYITQFLAKLRIRIADGCPTEGRITRMIEDQIRNATGEKVDLCRNLFQFDYLSDFIVYGASDHASTKDNCQ